MVKVLSLFSGSLASRVATRLVAQHPLVEAVYLLHFRSPFAKEKEDLRQLVRDEWPGVSYRTQSLKREYHRLVSITPGEPFSVARSCANCRRLLLHRATRYMERVNADFLVTGDIVGRHGVRGDDLLHIAENLGIRGRVLRPLCSEVFPPNPLDLLSWTTPTQVRTKLDEREASLQDLAVRLRLDPHDPMSSDARCKLTMPGFGDRVANLFSEAGFTLNSLRLLDFPLYYKVSPNTKIVVATSEQEKRDLQNLFLPQDLRVYPSTPHGPMTLVRTKWEEKSGAERQAIIGLAAQITATHAVNGRCAATPIYYRFENEDETMLVNVAAFSCPAEINALDRVEIVPLALSRTPVA